MNNTINNRLIKIEEDQSAPLTSIFRKELVKADVVAHPDSLKRIFKAHKNAIVGILGEPSQDRKAAKDQDPVMKAFNDLNW